MDERISELQDYLSNKQRHLLTFIDTKSDMNINFPVPIELNSNRNYQAGLLWFSAYNTIFNVDENNNQLNYSVDNQKYIASLDKGAYEINQMNIEFQRLMGLKDHAVISIGIDRSTSKSTITVPKGIEIDFSNSKTIGNILGFKKKVIKAGYHKSDNIVQITNISTINIECSIIQNSYINGKQTNIIYSFPSYTVPVGGKIIERISYPIYLPIIQTSTISNIQIRIVDEDGNLINFNGEEISMALELRQV